MFSGGLYLSLYSFAASLWEDDVSVGVSRKGCCGLEDSFAPVSPRLVVEHLAEFFLGAGFVLWAWDAGSHFSFVVDSGEMIVNISLVVE